MTVLDYKTVSERNEGKKGESGIGERIWYARCQNTNIRQAFFFFGVSVQLLHFCNSLFVKYREGGLQQWVPISWKCHDVQHYRYDIPRA